MIVVIGDLALGGTGADPVALGLAGRAARAAADAGARVEVVAKVGEGPAGDAVLLALAKAGIGHVASLRDAIHPTPASRSADDEAVDVVEAAGDDPQPPAIQDAPALEAADVALALRYLADYRVLVVLEPSGPGVVSEAIAAAGWSGAHLVVAATDAEGIDAGTLPPGALLLALDPLEMASGADDGPDGLVPMLGRYAAGVDAGEDPASAFAALTAVATATADALD